jgi:ribosomal protein S27AE
MSGHRPLVGEPTSEYETAVRYGGHITRMTHRCARCGEVVHSVYGSPTLRGVRVNWRHGREAGFSAGERFCRNCGSPSHSFCNR